MVNGATRHRSAFTHSHTLVVVATTEGATCSSGAITIHTAMEKTPETIWEFYILPKDTSTQRQQRPRIEPPTLLDKATEPWTSFRFNLLSFKQITAVRAVLCHPESHMFSALHAQIKSRSSSFYVFFCDTLNIAMETKTKKNPLKSFLSRLCSHWRSELALRSPSWPTSLLDSWYQGCLP